MTINKPMTGEQLDELMAVAVRMQRDAEVDRNFPSANFAYAVQVAVLELRRSRAVASALAAENAALKSAIQTHSESVHFCELCGKDDPCSTDDVCMVLNETPATDAFLAEVRAQGADAVADQHRRKYEELKTINVFFARDHRDAQKVAEFVAVQLRQEAAQ
ncbi:hypothetical protein [Leclercia adecarboxylata]|uniref:hypothetical protein n=1 Tax=Leclercia adecarboxylata TaxID=83655 RepID=UPI00124D013F|nr:hypothetical protein [Leclercia adecarboxylata]QFH50469.1 hypothetical protein FR819_14760 [Leclercia adecarboxylata]